MAVERDEAAFTFSWLALKLLGRGLYSNPWSALSELVANGFDAKATEVFVYVDIRNKSDAIVEVFDNGAGMSRSDINTYVKVGHNKRKEATNQGLTDIKGRKGIGKLAALFLSKHFYLETRHIGVTTSWELDARDDVISDEDTPVLQSTEGNPTTENDELWRQFASGTRLTLLNVDLTGYGPKSISALGARLANQFLLSEQEGSQILLGVRDSNAATKTNFVPVKKNVAFLNLAEIKSDFFRNAVVPEEFAKPLSKVKIPAKGLPNDAYFHDAEMKPFPPSTYASPEDEAWSEIEHRVKMDERTFDDIKFSLTGWIGVHATIDSEAARENDPRFEKNKYYNPAQIRVYVRGKLASDQLLNQLGLTGTYVNYIEGEISFDLLDEDALPDIATSNRQDFDETDGRVTLLRALVRPIVRSLMQDRQSIATAISKLQKAEKERQDTVGKKHFTEQLKADFDQHPEIPADTRAELEMVIVNKIQGEISPKQIFRVFISHSSYDERLASFIDAILQYRGADPAEIFYTSRAGSTEYSLDERALGELIKENIVNANTLIFYMTSKNFLASQYCLFEGGAGWATRSVSEYLKLNVDYKSIPTFLTNGRSEVELLDKNREFPFTSSLHNYLVEGVLNPMIKHLNRGREVVGREPIREFDILAMPSELELSRRGEIAEQYFDQDIVDHWKLYVDTTAREYIETYYPDDKSNAAPTQPVGE